MMFSKLFVAAVFFPLTVSSQSDDWRNVLEGVDGYPAGNMLEIALRRTQDDKLEMFKWRSEFIAMLGVQPGPLAEREWKSLSSWPPLTGAGTWTGMTWWENQQTWHDMANMIFPSPVTGNWLATINMTLCHVRPNDDDFDILTLAQSGEEVLELGILAYPSADSTLFNTALDAYLSTLDGNGATGTYTFDFFNNGFGFPGPFTTYYNANGGPNQDGSEAWKVYMAVWATLDEYEAANADGTVVAASLNNLKANIVEASSSIDVATRSTSKVCCKGEGQCELDPEECSVSVLGMGDTWAPNCAQCPQPCATDYNICSLLATQTCLDIGGQVKGSCGNGGGNGGSSGSDSAEDATSGGSGRALRFLF